MSEAPFRMRPAASASEAGNEVYRVFGQVAEQIDKAPWGFDYVVSSRDSAGRSHTRVVEGQRSSNQTGTARDNAMGSQLFMRHSMIEDLRRPSYPGPLEMGNITLTDSVSGRKPPTPIEEQGEDFLLRALGELSGRLLHLDQALAMEAGDLHSRIQECLKQRVRQRRAEARGEFDALTQQGREALKNLRTLEAERDGIREDRNRVIAKLNGAKQKLQVVKAQRPHDDDFPSLEDVAGWQEKFDAATAEADSLQAEVSSMQDDYRRASAAVAIAKQQVNAIRAERNAARTRAGIKAASEAKPDEDVIGESLTAG